MGPFPLPWKASQTLLVQIDAFAGRIRTDFRRSHIIGNVISTAYDIYDIAVTGYDLYKMIDEAMKQFDGKVFEIRPDVSIMGFSGMPSVGVSDRSMDD